MTAFKRSLLIGLAYGLAVAIVDFGVGGVRIAEMRMPLGAGNLARAAALEVGVGVALGVLATPLSFFFARPFVPAIAMGVAWIALARMVAPDPGFVAMWLTAPAAGLILAGIGYAVSRRFPRAAWSLAFLALAVALATPVVINRSQAAEILATHTNIEQGEARADAPDVVMVVLDTVRAANMSTYGYARETTPTVTRLAKEGVLFLDAVAPSTWSLPSHGSLFTGWFPSAHKVHAEHRMLGKQPPTLGDVLLRNGYDTFCFTANPHISDSFGLTRGFAWSDKAYLAGASGRSFLFIYRLLDLLGVSSQDKGGAQVAENFENWQAARAADDRPTFAFINFLEAHFPYHQTPRAFLAEFTDMSPGALRKFSLETFGAQFGRTLSDEQRERAIGPTTDMYDAGVLYSDHLLRRIVDSVEATGRLDRTILVVLADHGEMLGEHEAFGHGRSLHELDLHVPLLIRYPPSVRSGATVKAPVSTAGVFATILDLLDIEPPGRPQVTSLLPTMEGEPGGLPVIAERFVRGAAPRGAGQGLEQNVRYRVYRSGRLKLVNTDTEATYLFDLDADPQERNDLSTTRPQLVARLQGELDGWVNDLQLPAIDAEIDATSEAEMDPATRERLKALGYLD